MSEEFTSIDNLNIENQSITNLSLTNISPDQIYSEPLLIEDLLSDDTTLDPIPMCSPNISNITPFYKQGIDGQTLYVWIKFADTPTSGMSDISTGKDYLGIAVNKPSQTESLVYSDYQWIKLNQSGGSPVITERLDSWVDYDSTRAGWVLSAYLGKDLDTRLNNAYNRFLRKDVTDTAQRLIQFIEGITIGDFRTGLLGSGAAIKNVNGTTIAEVDQLLVRQRAEFFSVLIHEARSVGGQLIISAANLFCTKVEEFSDFYRCYFDSKNGEVANLFANTDFARSQIFTGTRQKFYWRKVIAVGTDYIELSKTNAAINSDIPEVGDTIFQLGSTDVNRQGAMILSTVGIDAPSFIQYSGIDSFSLEGKELTKFTRLGNRVSGKTVFVSSGSNLDDWADGTSQDIQNAQGAANAAALAAQQAIDDAAANVGLINTEVGKLQAQIDGEVSNWFYPYSPTLANYPASEWTTNAIKDRHIGDTFTNTAQAPATDAGKSWRFLKNSTVYSWTQIADSDAVLALQKAAQAQSTADGKSTTYLIQPTSYKFGDMWVLAADTTVNGIAYKAGEILTATQDSTTFVQSHWVKKVRYTDDTAVNNLQIGGDNLLRNAGFVGDFASIELDSQQTIEASTELFNNRLAYWEQTGTLTIVDEPLAKYGKAIVINGSISQAVQSISNDKYKFRVKGKGNVSVSFSGNTKTIDLGDTYTEIELDFKGDGLLSQFIISSENATIFNPKLERGTVATDMSLHHLDENPAFERLLSYQYILDAIGNGSTSILGGLILTSMIQLGKYKDGVMEKVNAGISGIYNNDNDPAVWAGGTMEMAIRTVQKFIANPNYQPTEAEWAEMAKIVFTHGGDGFFRGYIYALGGFFRGRIESNVSGNRIIVNPENRSIEMINSQNRLSGQIFFSEGSGWGAVQFYDYHANGTLKTVASLDLVNGVYFSEYADGNPVPVKITYSKNGQIQNGGIPSMTDAQADTLLVSGEWYRDGRTLKIKP